MAETTVIQEFLAELGFKVDQKTLGDFNKALKSNATQAVAFGKTWSDLAESVGRDAAKMVKGVFELTSQLDQLYFASRRMQDTASNISAMSYVFKQMGLAPEKGEAFGEFIQEKQAAYGKEGFARWANALAPGAGVLPSDSPEIANRKIMDALSKGAQDPRTQQQTYYRLRAMGGPISWQDVQQWDPTKSQQFWEQSKKSQEESGAALDQNAKAANDAATSFRHLSEQVDNFKIGVLGPFLPMMKQGADSMSNFADAASGLARGIEAITRAWTGAKAAGVPPSALPGGGAGVTAAQPPPGTGTGPGFVPGQPGVRTGGLDYGGNQGTPWWQWWGNSTQPAPTTHPGAHAAPPPQPGGPVPANLLAPDISSAPPPGAHSVSVKTGNPLNRGGGASATWAEGLAKGEALLRYYYGHHHRNTIAALIHFWAGDQYPGNAKGSEAFYAKYLASQLGVGVNQPFDYSAPGVIGRTANAMAAFEGGWWNRGSLNWAASHGGGGGTQNFTFHIRSTDPTRAAHEVKRVFDRHTARQMRPGALQ